MWLPDRITPVGANSRTKPSETSQGWISQYTCVSRRRRAMSCVYCAPKSRISMREWDAAGIAPSERVRAGTSESTSIDAIVGSFLHDLHVVDVRLAHAGGRDLDELGARGEFLDG